MKKLMLGFAASAALVATSTYAGDDLEINEGVGFESTEGYEADAGTAGLAKWLFEGSATDASTVKAYGTAPTLPSGYAPLAGLSGVGSQYLNLKTDGGTLWRAFTNETTGAKIEIANMSNSTVYVDTLVQFTYSEDAPDVAAPNKLAIWWGSNGDESKTNLYVTAGQYAAEEGTGALGTKTTHHFCITNVTVTEGAWYRLTVKATTTGVAEDMGDSAAYQVYLNEVLCKASESAVSKDCTELTDLADWLKGTYFPPIDASEDLVEVGFQGQGKVDNLAFTTFAPAFCPAEVQMTFTITWDSHVTQVFYAIGNEEYTLNGTDLEAGSKAITVAGVAGDVALTVDYDVNTTYATGWQAGTWTFSGTYEGETPSLESNAYVMNIADGLTVNIVSAEKANYVFSLADVPQGLSVTSLTYGDPATTVEPASGMYTVPTSAGDLTLTVTASDGKIFKGGTKTAAVTIAASSLTDGQISVGTLFTGDAEVIDTPVAIIKNEGATTNEYASFEFAFKAAVDGDTITFLQNFTGPFVATQTVNKTFYLAASNFMNGLTIDLNGKTWTLDGLENERVIEDRCGNSWKFKNGSIAIASGATQNIAFYTYAEMLEFENVALDFSNLSAVTASETDPRKNSAIVSQNGSVKFSGTTTVTLASGFSPVLMLDRANDGYEPGTLTIDVNGTFAGDIQLYSECKFVVGANATLGGNVYVGSACCSAFDPAGAAGTTPFKALLGTPIAKTGSTSTSTRYGQMYATFEAALAAARTTGDTITLLNNDAITKTNSDDDADADATLFALAINYDLTIDAAGDYTLTGPTNQYGIIVGNDATLTLKGGTLKPYEGTSRTMLNVGYCEAKKWTHSAGNFVLDGGTISGVTAGGNAIAAQTGTVTITSGTIKNIGGRGVKAELNATIVINGGTIGDANTLAKPSCYVADAGQITINGGTIYGACQVKAGATGTITVPTSSTAKFENDYTCYLADQVDYKMVAGSDGWYTVKQIVAPVVTLSQTIAEYAAALEFPTVTVAGDFTKDTDYTVSAWNPAAIVEPEAGKTNDYVVTITMIGGYTGTTNATFKVFKAAAASDPLPVIDNPTDQQAQDQIAKTAWTDATVATTITNAAEYTAFQQWSTTVTGGSAAIVASEHAIESYALGVTTLLTESPEIEVTKVEADTATAGNWNFDVEITGATSKDAIDAAVASVKKLVKVGTSLSAMGAPADADVSVTKTATGKYKANVKPTTGATSYFFKLEK